FSPVDVSLCVFQRRSTFCFLSAPLPPTRTLFPYTTLFRSASSASRARAAVPRFFISILATEKLQHVVRVDPVIEIAAVPASRVRSEEHTSELQSRENLVCRLLLEKKKKISMKD